jgi:eukaryotic-like serine/threonine-protein kinase
MGFLAKLQALFKSKPKSNLPKIDVGKRFQLLGRTGQGSMSKVWKARDLTLGRIVCLKILDKEKTKKFDDRFPGLNRPMEGAICASLRHKNVVRTLEYALTTKGEQFLVMELIEGDGLNLLIETKSSSLNGKRVDFLIQMADGLEYVHSQKYLHRDICPRNVMVTRDGVVKIIDFGLTIPYTADFCKPGNRTGTINYLAPELIKRTTTDHRVDLFALGVTGYELLSGSLPWEKAPSMQTLLSHMNSGGRDPRDFNKELDAPTAKLLMKAVERDPRDRFQSAAEFREALKALPRKDW